MNNVAPATPTSCSSPIRWSACLIAGLVSAVIAVQADAAIVTIDLASAGSGSTNITGFDAGMKFNDPKISVSDFVTGGTLEIFRSQFGIGLEGDGDLMLAVTGGDSSPRNYASGATIDATATYSGNDAETLFYFDAMSTAGPSSAANFGAGSFMGFRFGNSGNHYYGYIEVLWTWTGDPSTSSFQLLSAAYESTANTGILAGGAAPVPGAGGLLTLMALGGGGAFRRRGRH